jgi:hypothetical protein
MLKRVVVPPESEWAGIVRLGCRRGPPGRERYGVNIFSDKPFSANHYSNLKKKKANQYSLHSKLIVTIFFLK